MIYIGNFIYSSSQQSPSEDDRRHGDFSLIMEAASSEEAIAAFRRRISSYHDENRFFEGDCKIYFTRLLEFDRFPKTGAFMINFRSVAGDPVMPFIECTIPSDETDGCKISDWSENTPRADGRNEEVFMSLSV